MTFRNRWAAWSNFRLAGIGSRSSSRGVTARSSAVFSRIGTSLRTATAAGRLMSVENMVSARVPTENSASSSSTAMVRPGTQASAMALARSAITRAYSAIRSRWKAGCISRRCGRWMWEGAVGRESPTRTRARTKNLPFST